MLNIHSVGRCSPSDFRYIMWSMMYFLIAILLNHRRTVFPYKKYGGYFITLSKIWLKLSLCFWGFFSPICLVSFFFNSQNQSAPGNVIQNHKKKSLTIELNFSVTNHVALFWSSSHNQTSVKTTCQNFNQNIQYPQVKSSCLQ